MLVPGAADGCAEPSGAALGRVQPGIGHPHQRARVVAGTEGPDPDAGGGCRRSAGREGSRAGAMASTAAAIGTEAQRR